MRRFVSKWIWRGPIILGTLAFLAWTVLREGWAGADPVASVVGIVLVLVLMMWPKLSPAAVTAMPVAPGPVAVPDGWVDRAEARQVVDAVLARTRRRWRGGGAVAITAGLHGAGGFGKTTLARFAVAQPKVRKRFPGGIWFITIGRDVRGRAAVAAKAAAEMARITGVESTAGDDPEQVGGQLGKLLASRPRTLLVIDDVWEEEQLRPFLIGAEQRCVRLITTRNPSVLPAHAARITVDRMTYAQARQVLTKALPDLPDQAVIDDLVEATGRWVLLLRIANRVMSEQLSTGDDANEVGRRLLDRLQVHGPAASDPQKEFNLDDTHERNQAVRASLAAATRLLPTDGEHRFAELGVFAEDEAIPIALVARLWEGTAGLDETTARSLCRHMADLSLLSLDSAVPGGTVALHDVIRDHLRAELSARLPAVNAALLDTLTAIGEGGPEWWTTPSEYLRDFLVAHLVDAERTVDAVALATDFRWVSMRLHHHGPTAPLRDLALVPHADADALTSHLERTAHLLTPTTPPQALDAVLRSRVPGGAEWLAAADTVLSRPALVDLWSPPDMPSSALLRALTHQASVDKMAMSLDGSCLATMEISGRVRVWDVSSGAQVCELPRRRRRVRDVAFSNGGTQLLTLDGDSIVGGWDLATGSELGQFFPGACRAAAFSADGSLLFTGLDSGVVAIWDTSNGAKLNEYRTPGNRRTGRLLVSQDGAKLVFSMLGGMRSYACDADTGDNLRSFRGRPVAVTADGAHVAVDQGGDVGIWNTSSGERLCELRGCLDVTVAAFNPAGTELAVGSREGTVEVWDIGTKTQVHRFYHGSLCSSLSFSSDGLRLTSASMDATVRIWDLSAGSPQRQEISVGVTAVSADGSRVATVSREGFSVWDAASGVHVQRFARGDGAAGQELRFVPPIRGDKADLLSAAFSATGIRFAAAVDREKVGVWDAAGTLLVQFTCGGPLEKLALSPLGDLLVTVDRQGAISLWDAANGMQMHQLTDHSARGFVFSSDGSRLATYGHSDGPSVWNTASGVRLSHLARRSAGALAFSPDNSQLVIADINAGCRVVDIATEAVVHRFRGSRIRAAAFSPDGKYLAGTGNNTISVWDATTGEPLTSMRADSDLESVIWHPGSRAFFVGGRGLLGYEFLV